MRTIFQISLKDVSHRPTIFLFEFPERFFRLIQKIECTHSRQRGTRYFAKGVPLSYWIKVHKNTRLTAGYFSNFQFFIPEKWSSFKNREIHWIQYFAYIGKTSKK